MTKIAMLVDVFFPVSKAVAQKKFQEARKDKRQEARSPTCENVLGAAAKPLGIWAPVRQQLWVSDSHSEYACVAN